MARWLKIWLACEEPNCPAEFSSQVTFSPTDGVPSFIELKKQARDAGWNTTSRRQDWCPEHALLLDRKVRVPDPPRGTSRNVKRSVYERMING